MPWPMTHRAGDQPLPPKTDLPPVRNVNNFFLMTVRVFANYKNMKNLSPSVFIFLGRVARRIVPGFVLAAGTVTMVHAQGELGSGTVSGSGFGPYTYSLSFTDLTGATSPIGSVWYAWTPGNFYLPGAPTSASAPSGWTATISSDSIQFVANSSANDITAGQTLSGFSYQASFSPAQLAAAANSGKSDAYSGALFSDSGNIFTVQAVPEPSGQWLWLAGAALGWLVGRRKLQTT
jgi:hypothetical protein